MIGKYFEYCTIFILKKGDLRNVYDTELKYRARWQKTYFSLTDLRQHVASVGVIVNVA